MPEPIKEGRRYLPGLDGLRAIAVLGVIAYHVGLASVPGGLLGVSVFFTLSGYLITDLLLSQVSAGDLSLRSFWLARARRLLPAMFMMLLVVAAWVTVLGPHQTTAFRDGAASAALYVNNWWAILRDVSYFAQFDAPGPLNHLWSLSVEEQFYVVWPLLLVAGTRLVREPARRVGRPRLGLVVLALAACSAVTMAAVYEPGTDPSRVYYGTDTRAAELLVGAALATVWPSRRLQSTVAARARGLIDGVGVAGLLVIAVLFARTEAFSSFLYRGGFVLLSIATAAVVASVAHPASRLGPLLGCRPLRWIGARSYGLYLWHVPIIVLTTPDGATYPSAPRALLQVAATFVVAGLSWRFVEDPIRHGALGRLWAEWREGAWRGQRFLTPARGAAMTAAVLVVVPALAGFAGAGVEDAGTPDEEITISETVTAGPTTTGGPTTTAPGDEDALGPCTSVVHVGDSTSLGLVSTAYLPDEADQSPAQYARVGVTTQHYEIAGGRAIIESYKDNPAARDSAQRWRDDGYRGCWVMALGTMDAANVAVGSPVGHAERIDQMMAIAEDDPVLWVNAATIKATGSWQTDHMLPWNEALLEACARHPNLRVYDWAAEVQDDWYSSDQIHQNTEGYAARAKGIADALAAAFPGPGAEASGCVVRG